MYNLETIGARIPANSIVATVLNKDKNKVYYAADVFKEVRKVTPISYTAVCSALVNFPSVKLKGTYRYVYGHPAALKKLREGFKNKNWTSPYIPIPPTLLITQVFNKYKKRVFTPVEMYIHVKDSVDIPRDTLKAAMGLHFPHISLSKTCSYYGHKVALNEFEQYLKNNKIRYTRILNKIGGK